MGDLINKTEAFKMRKLEADIERANNANFHEQFAEALLFNNLARKLNATIILRTKPEG